MTNSIVIDLEVRAPVDFDMNDSFGVVFGISTDFDSTETFFVENSPNFTDYNYKA